MSRQTKSSNKLYKKLVAQNMGLALSLIKNNKAKINCNIFELETFRFILEPLSILFTFNQS